MTIRRMTRVALALSMLSTVAPSMVFAQSALPYGTPITIDHAKQAAAAATAEMRTRNMEMTIAIVDSGSNLVYRAL